MNVVINGERSIISENLTVSEVLSELNLNSDFIAVAINQSVVPRSQFCEHKISEGDDIEILSPMSGG